MAYPTIPDDAFPPGRNEPCFCDSGKRFKHCCGNRSDTRAPPHGVGVVPDFLTRHECEHIVRMADRLDGKRFTVTDNAGRQSLDPHRATEWVDFRDVGQRVLDATVRRAFAEHVLPATGQSIDWYEQPELLRYASGDFYRHHSDAYYLVPEQRAWRKAVDRDISILIYLNDGFTGGELEFKRLHYRLQPAAGMLVWFPSDVRYEHMARPVESGKRYCLVSWAAASGIERVQAQPAARSIPWRSDLTEN